MNMFNSKITSEKELLLLGNMYVVSRALHVVAEQKIADLFEDDQPRSIDQLVEQRPMSPIALKKVLRVLCPFGIFSENDDGTFSLEEIGQALKSSHPSCMRDLLFCEDCRWNSFGQMSESLRTGETGFSKLYNEEYFDYIARHSSLQAGFDSHMKAVSITESPMIAQFLPLENKKKIVDVGGGKGGLIDAVLKKYPHIMGGIFELPGVAEQDIKNLSDQHKGRLNVFSGSFFDALPFKTDGIVLKRILHDWDDASCIRILSRCRDALEGSSGEIYIVESLVKGSEDSTLLRIFDLLLLTVFGGFERSLEEYISLFYQAGMQLKNVSSTDSEMSVLVAKKI